MRVAEADFEDMVLELLAEQGWETINGGLIAPDMPGAER